MARKHSPTSKIDALYEIEKRRITSIRIKRTSGTYAETLAACGLARLLDEAFARPGTISSSDSSIRIVEEPNAWVITLPAEITADALRRVTPGPYYRYVKMKASEPAPLDAFDWEVEREQENAFRQARKTVTSLPPKDRAAFWDKIRTMAPDPELTLIKAIYGLKAIGAINKAWPVLSSLGTNFASEVAGGILRVAGEASQERPLIPEISTLQAFNPAAGKGINRTKANGTQLAQLPELLCDDPFLECRFCCFVWQEG